MRIKVNNVNTDTKNEKYFLSGDEALRVLGTRKDLEKCLKAISEDEWLENVPVNRLHPIGVENYPLFYGEQTTNLHADEDGHKVPLKDIDLDDGDAMNCVESGYGVFLAFPKNGEYDILPTRRIAWNDMTDRAGMTCATMLAFDKRDRRDVLPVREKTEFLSRVYRLYKSDCKILVRMGKISGVKSSEYCILPAPELIPEMEKALKVDHPDLEYAGGSFSHEYLQCEYFLNDPLAEDEFLHTLRKLGINAEKVRAGVRFSTSDVGNSSVMVTPFVGLKLPNAPTVNIQFGSNIKLAHKDGATIDKFVAMLDGIGNCLKDNEEKIERLGNIPINNPGETIKRIREKYPVFSKSVTERVAEKYEAMASATAIDVYLAFAEIMAEQGKEEQMSPTKYIGMCDTCAKLLSLPYEAIDAGREWRRV